MQSSRRVSLTLLFVAPLFTSETASSKGTPLVQTSMSQEVMDVEEKMGFSGYEKNMAKDVGLFRARRTAHESEEIMETAEQIMFRPMFRHKQIMKERTDRLKSKTQSRLSTSSSSSQAAPSSFDDPTTSISAIQNMRFGPPSSKFSSTNFVGASFVLPNQVHFRSPASNTFPLSNNAGTPTSNHAQISQFTPSSNLMFSITSPYYSKGSSITNINYPSTGFQGHDFRFFYDQNLQSVPLQLHQRLP